MKRSKFSKEQIVYAFRQVKSATPPSDLCCQLGIAEQALLCVEEEVCASGRERTPAVAPTGGGEQPIETARGRFLTG